MKSQLIVEVPKDSLEKFRRICKQKKTTQKKIINKYINKIIEVWDDPYRPGTKLININTQNIHEIHSVSDNIYTLDNGLKLTIELLSKHYKKAL